MRRTSRLFSLMVLGLGFAMGTPAEATSACDVLVADTAEEVLGAAIPQVAEHAQALAHLGVEVRVRTVGYTSNLDLDEWSQRQQCPSWQSPNGNRKSTLMVLMLSPSARKLGLYYGEAWHRALDDHWNRIKSEVMAPRFRDGDYAGGFSAGLDQLARRLTTAQDEAIHPTVQQTTTTQTIVHEATDVSAFWFVPWLFVGVVVVGAGIFLFFFIRDERDGAEQAQQEAIVAKNEATALLGSMDRHTYPTWQQAAYDAVAQAYAEFSMSGHGDPTLDGLRTAAYRTMAKRYGTFVTDLKNVPYVRHPRKEKAMRHCITSMCSQAVQCPACQHCSDHCKHGPRCQPRAMGRIQKSVPGGTYRPAATTVVQNNIIATGGSSSQSDSGSSWWSSSSSGSSGGSSSYDSGSSGGGGSSSYDSGSSGGGGSSSYDSGSSGGGGSSDF